MLSAGVVFQYGTIEYGRIELVFESCTFAGGYSDRYDRDRRSGRAFRRYEYPWICGSGAEHSGKQSEADRDHNA